MIRELVIDSGSDVLLQMTDKLANILRAHRISFGERQPEQVPLIKIRKDAIIEPYFTYYYGGHFMSTTGAFSYTMSKEAYFASIGRFCSIASHVRALGERHPIEHVTTSSITHNPTIPSFRWARDDLLQGSSEIIRPLVHTDDLPVAEHDVWVGTGALIQQGVTLHTGSIVGAGAVVTKDVPPYAIVGGVPARTLRMRFSDRVIDRLLASRWWEFHPKILFQLDVRDVSGFLAGIDAAEGSLTSFRPAPITWEGLFSSLDAG